ncbi:MULTISPECIES: hypothetical protein [unclassified Brevibacterium]|uniref:hypothetical protein n=1 Tax=unclassified Brevibacterium TaxID=2614124 RepID=UPI001E57CD4D|nr:MULTISPECIES: hypothetical protein [unclassified Brevibacterium]MCD1287315.1 hypothetical protein [Brevibacterium sp. CCUG 69071]MDK8436431.1 hypothetical protein [Brevibacterium sp. H-BE7]
MSTVDEILTTGRYTDRRGREWAKHNYYHGTVEWMHPLGDGTCHINTPTQMRLLIERDMHRDVCEGLYRCSNHPTPKVLAYAGLFTVTKARRLVEAPYDTLPEAMDAARALAVRS